MVDNLQLYNAVRSVPDTAQKPIQGGRLRGMTDINPMWRIRELTNQFGPCGVGWKYEITNKQLQEGANGEIAAFVDINLSVKIDDEWSDAIPGTGGSMFVAREKSGLYVSDECFKMALTDAISVACKALGFAADVYWQGGESKYGRESAPSTAPETAGQSTRTDIPPDALTCHDCEADITAAMKALSVRNFGRPLCPKCQREAEK